MKFLAKSVTGNNNLLLELEGAAGSENENGSNAVSRKTRIFLKKKEVGFVFETIASVKKPFYLARAKEGVDARELVGKTLETESN